MNIKLILISTLSVSILLTGKVQGQTTSSNTNNKATNIYSTYYYQRATLFEILPIDKDDIVFLGNSITDICEWAELLNNPNIKNRGISGDIAQGVYDRLDPIIKGAPSKIFFMIGINDVSHDVSADSIVRAIAKVCTKIQTETPETKLYIQSVLPVNPDFGKFLGATKRGDVVIDINNGLQELCKKEEIPYIDIYSHLVTPTGKLKPELSNDGLHLLANGYLIWKSILKNYL